MKTKGAIALAVGALAIVGFWLAWRENRSARELSRSLAAALAAQTRLAGEIAEKTTQNALTGRHLVELQEKTARLEKPDRPPPAKSEDELLREAYLDPRLQTIQQRDFRARVRLDYGPLYRRLGLTPDQIERFEGILTEHEERRLDVQATAADLNLAMKSPEIASLTDNNNQQLKVEEAEFLGPAGYDQLLEFQNTKQERGIVDQLTRDLAFTSAPLLPQENDQLMQTLRAAHGSDESGGANAAGGLDWDLVQRQAASYLSPPQAAELASSLARARYKQVSDQLSTMVALWEKEASANGEAMPP